MSDSFTKVADLIVRDEFAEYLAQAMVDRSTLIKSGIAAVDDAITAATQAAGSRGNFVSLPFFNQLGGGVITGAEVIKDDGTKLTVEKVTASEDVAVIMRRGKAFGSSDLAAMVAGEDPLSAVAAGLADWWNAEKQKRLIQVLEGAFASALASHVSGSASTALTADAILDAANTLGDRKGDITAYAMNSSTENFLMKLNTSYMFRPSDSPARLTTFNGRTVVVDDNIADGVIYLFGQGAVALNPCAVANPVEPFRDELASQGGIISRDASIVHIRGVKWATTVTNPDNAALATSANYALAYPHKLVRVAKLVSKISAE